MAIKPAKQEVHMEEYNKNIDSILNHFPNWNRLGNIRERIDSLINFCEDDKNGITVDQGGNLYCAKKEFETFETAFIDFIDYLENAKQD